MENKPSRSVLAYRMSKDVSQGGDTARQSGQQSEGLGPQKHWLGSGKGQHARGREVSTEGQVGRAPFCTPLVLSCFGLCASSRPLPGRVTSRPPREPRSSYAKNVRAEHREGGPFRPRSQHAHSTKTRPDTPTPAERHRHGNGITGAKRCLFSTQCQETRPGGGQAHLPGWGREGARHWSQGSLTPSGRRHRKLRLPSRQRVLFSGPAGAENTH